MSMNPSDLLRAMRPDGAGGQERIKVLVALRRDAADPACRDRLQRLGLAVDGAVRNKLVGSIPAAQLDALRADPDVAEVEPSVPLRPHSR